VTDPRDKPPPSDDATDAQSQAEIERLERLARERGLDAGPEDSRPRKLAPVRPAPASEQKEYVVASPVKRERDTIKFEGKVEIHPHPRPRDVERVAEEAGIAPDEFKKLKPARSRSADTALAMRLDPKVAEAVEKAKAAMKAPETPEDRTVGGNTVRLEPAEPTPLPPVPDVDLGDFDPSQKTVGGRTVKGLPRPEGLSAGERDEGEDAAHVETPAAPDSSGAFATHPAVPAQRSRIGLVVFAVIAFIGGGVAVIASLDVQDSATTPSAATGQPVAPTAAAPEPSAPATSEPAPSSEPLAPTASTAEPAPWPSGIRTAPTASAEPKAPPVPVPSSSGRPDIPFD
jgi:hypothetical protein